MESAAVCESCQHISTLCICVLALPPIHDSLVSVAPPPDAPPAPVLQQQEEDGDTTSLLDAVVLEAADDTTTHPPAPPMTDEVERELLVLLSDADAAQHHLHLKLRICTLSLYQLPLEDFFASLDPSVTSPQRFDQLCRAQDVAVVTT